VCIGASRASEDHRSGNCCPQATLWGTGVKLLGMAAEVALTDGTKIRTEDNVNSDEVLKSLSQRVVGFAPIRTSDGQTFRVNPSQVVYVRDVGPNEPLVAVE
jgi:hypothetical protein